MLRKLLGGCALAALMAGSAFAQNVPAPGAVLVTQSGTRADAASFWVGQANGATACNAVSQTAANGTVTIPAPSGTQSIYLTNFTMQINQDATGATQAGTISFTGVPTVGATPPFLSQASTLTTVQGNVSSFAIPMNPPLKLLAATAFTAVPSATQSAHDILCMTAQGYYAP